MKIKLLYWFLALSFPITICTLYSFRNISNKLPEVFIDDMPVAEVLLNLGQEKGEHYMSDSQAELVDVGYTLLTEGKADYKNYKGKRISINFVCTDCHSLEKEFASETTNSPEDRLSFAQKNNKPFLPASTLWGVYNRKTFYNGDYFKKYGSLVVSARDTLENAVQLCAKYCSSGRYLESWELEAIMHYFKFNELKIKDLPITENDKKNILKYQQLDEETKLRISKSIDSLVRDYYPATFLTTLPHKDRKYGEGGNVENGSYIFKNSCLHCHQNNRVTYLDLADDKMTARMFMRNIETYSEYSIYQIVRYGTYPKTGRPQYMPLYTEEKMSDSQINDLIAYLKKLAE